MPEPERAFHLVLLDYRSLGSANALHAALPLRPVIEVPSSATLILVCYCSRRRSGANYFGQVQSKFVVERRDTMGNMCGV